MADRTVLRSMVTGALAGAALTIPLIAILYAAQQAFGLPFAPFDVFDFTARRLPGAVITFGIDTMVAVINGFGIGEISETAKTAERVLAVGGLIGTGTAIGAALFAALERWHGPALSVVAGTGLGIALGFGVTMISLSVHPDLPLGTALSALWSVAIFAGWGGTLGWAYRRLAPRAMAAVDGDVPQISVEPIDRRRFIVRVGGAAAGITVVGASVGAAIAARRTQSQARARGIPWSDLNPLPNRSATVMPVRGTRSELTPVEDHYTIDINTRPPVVDESSWRLRIGGLVNQPTSWRLDELKTTYAPQHQFITLACISNPVGGSLTGTQRWTGIPLRALLADVQPNPNATHLLIRSVDGFHETLPIADVMADERIMLTYAWDGLPLPAEHGFPLRIYLPDRYGMKQPKWIAEIEVADHAEDGYWVSRGWDREARMRATAVIDSVGVDMMLGEATETLLVPIGGIAHAGARGISRVELQVDAGDWIEAELREPLSGTTWVIWRIDWPFAEGEHTFTVRCVDGDGTSQIEQRASPRPAGATGLHSEDVML